MSPVELSNRPPARRRAGVRPTGVLALLGIGVALTVIMVGLTSGVGMACKLGVVGACVESSSQSFTADRPARPTARAADGSLHASFALNREDGVELDTDPLSAVRGSDGNLAHGDLFLDYMIWSRS